MSEQGLGGESRLAVSVLAIREDLEDPAPPALDDLDAESFAGEDAAVLTHLGPGAIVLDRSAPSLFEGVLGLSEIAHVRRPDGTEAGRGVGWHGTAAFVLVADFSRHGRPLPAPPDLEAVLNKTLRARDPIRHETRLDARGRGVVARRPDNEAAAAVLYREREGGTVDGSDSGGEPEAGEPEAGSPAPPGSLLALRPSA